MSFQYIPAQPTQSLLFLASLALAIRDEQAADALPHLAGGRDLCEYCGRSVGAEGPATRILDTNPVLEALGNAKSIRNNNSSRFGKYVNLKFKGLKVMARGAYVFAEKSRVTNASLAKERSYHIFDQVLAGSQTEGQDCPSSRGHPTTSSHEQVWDQLR